MYREYGNDRRVSFMGVLVPSIGLHLITTNSISNGYSYIVFQSLPRFYSISSTFKDI